MLSITDGKRAEDSGMNTRLAYAVKHIQKGPTLLANSNAGTETPADDSEYYSAPVWKRFGGHL